MNYFEKTEEMLKGEIIKEISVDGYEITITTEDNLRFEYYASDGGYSSWDLCDIEGGANG